MCPSHFICNHFGEYEENQIIKTLLGLLYLLNIFLDGVNGIIGVIFTAAMSETEGLFIYPRIDYDLIMILVNSNVPKMTYRSRRFTGC